jgi:hypothetical protein
MLFKMLCFYVNYKIKREIWSLYCTRPSELKSLDMKALIRKNDFSNTSLVVGFFLQGIINYYHQSGHMEGRRWQDKTGYAVSKFA